MGMGKDGSSAVWVWAREPAGADLGGLVLGGVEALDGDLAEHVGLQRLLGEVAVVDDGWAGAERARDELEPPPSGRFHQRHNHMMLYMNSIYLN